MQNSNTPCTIYFSLIVRETIPRAETRGMSRSWDHISITLPLIQERWKNNV